MSIRVLIIDDEPPSGEPCVTPTTRAVEVLPLEEVERRYIHQVLESVQGNKTVAARLLGLDRTTLYRKLRRESLSAA